jgi:hypothetical protein
VTWIDLGRCKCRLEYALVLHPFRSTRRGCRGANWRRRRARCRRCRPRRGRVRHFRRTNLSFGGVIVGEDATDGGENFLHRWFLRFRRLRHPRILASAPPESATASRPSRAQPNRIIQAKSRNPDSKYGISKVERKHRLAQRRIATVTAKSWLPAVGRPHANPGVAHLLIVHLRIVDRHVEPEHRHRQPADGRQQ